MYECLKKTTYSIDNYNIIPFREQDIYCVKEWRNSQLDVLRQNYLLTNDGQKKYFETIISASFKENYPGQILFSFFVNDELIGYGGLVHIRWEDKRGEISFLSETKRSRDKTKYAEDFGAFLKLIKMVAYEDLELNRLYTETFDIRPLHVDILEANGFILEGRMKQHNMINNKFVDSVIHGNVREYENVKK